MKKYFLVVDFGTLVECDKVEDIPELFGFRSWQEMVDDNGGIFPYLEEWTKEDYDNDEYYDCI